MILLDIRDVNSPLTLKEITNSEANIIILNILSKMNKLGEGLRVNFKELDADKVIDGLKNMFGFKTVKIEPEKPIVIPMSDFGMKLYDRFVSMSEIYHGLRKEKDAPFTLFVLEALHEFDKSIMFLVTVNKRRVVMTYSEMIYDLSNFVLTSLFKSEQFKKKYVIDWNSVYIVNNVFDIELK